MCKVKIALCQMDIENDKMRNLNKALDMTDRAATLGTDIVVFPEMFNCPYDTQYFHLFSENIKTSVTINELSNKAKEKKVYIAAGTIAEKDGDDLYNTCLFFNKQGEIISKYRKTHLFDVDVKDKVTFKESDTFKKGEGLGIANTEYGKIGFEICYDIRFPELSRALALKGTNIIIVPAAFNINTGKAHWEVLFRSRAIDNQIFMVGVSPARNNKSKYTAYGNSLVVNPWGDIIGKMDEKEGLIICEIDLGEIKEVRTSMPLFNHRRIELYNTKNL